MLAYHQCQVVMLCERYALGALFLTLRLGPESGIYAGQRSFNTRAAALSTGE